MPEDKSEPIKLTRRQALKAGLVTAAAALGMPIPDAESKPQQTERLTLPELKQVVQDLAQRMTTQWNEGPSEIGIILKDPNDSIDKKTATLNLSRVPADKQRKEDYFLRSHYSNTDTDFGKEETHDLDKLDLMVHNFSILPKDYSVLKV
jgi:hypothetical protein